MVILCPACSVALTKRAALSRYVNLYICSDCGSREAREGFFWEPIFNPNRVYQPANFNPFTDT